MSAPLPLPGTNNPFTGGYQTHQFFQGSPNAPIGSRQVLASLANPSSTALASELVNPLEEEADLYNLTPQIITITNNPASGTFTLNYLGQITSAIQYNASAATLQAALRALSTIGGTNATVAGNAGGPWTVTFTLTPPLALLVVQNNSLVTTPGSGVPQITITSPAAQAGIVPF